MKVKISPERFSNIYTRQLRIIHWNGHCTCCLYRVIIIVWNLVLKVYTSMFDRDEESDECASQSQIKPPDHNSFTSNPFLDIPNTTNAIEYKKGYVMRKCCYEANAKRSEYFQFNLAWNCSTRSFFKEFSFNFNCLFYTCLFYNNVNMFL